MSESADPRSIAERWSPEDLLRLWTEVKRDGPPTGLAKGAAFEYLVIRAFHLEGADVVWPYSVTYPQKFGTMEQIDGLVYVDGRAYLIESKNLSEPAAIEAIAKLRFRLESRPPGTMGLLFSVGNFSTPTEVFAQFASPLNVLLWSSADLDVALPARSMIESLRKKYRYAAEHGLPLLPLQGDQ